MLRVLIVCGLPLLQAELDHTISALKEELALVQQHHGDLLQAERQRTAALQQVRCLRVTVCVLPCLVSRSEGNKSTSVTR